MHYYVVNSPGGGIGSGIAHIFEADIAGSAEGGKWNIAGGDPGELPISLNCQSATEWCPGGGGEVAPIEISGNPYRESVMFIIAPGGFEGERVISTKI